MDNYSFSFERLDAWKDSRELVIWVYQTTEHFPKEERFGLISQMRRASISVVSNLAEGCSRTGLREQAYFSQISFSSLLELLTQLIISADLNYVTKDILVTGRDSINNLAKKIGALRNSQLRRLSKP